MDSATVLIKIAQMELHLAGLRTWHRQEMAALADSLLEMKRSAGAVHALSQSIAGCELELEFLKGVRKI